MKIRLFLFLLAAGGIIGLLWVRPQRSPSPAIENTVQSGKIPQQQTNSLFPSSHVARRFSPLPLERGENDLPNGEILDLTQRIQAALKTGELADHDLVFNHLLLDLIKKDPTSAARLAESMPSGTLREEMLRRVAQHWTEQDPASAKQWAEQLSDVRERNSALTDVCCQIAQTDPQQATQMADQIGLGNLPGATLENLVQQWAARDLTTAEAWVNERPAGEEKDKLFSRIAMVLAESSPAEAARMVVDQIPAGDTQTEAVVSVLYQWAKSDLPGARAWVQLFPEGPLRERALNELKGAETYQNTASQLKP
jgi:hypothetical protein